MEDCVQKEDKDLSMKLFDDHAGPNMEENSVEKEFLRVPSCSSPMHVKLNEDPWRPMHSKKRYSDTCASVAAISNGHVDRIQNGEMSFNDKQEVGENWGDEDKEGNIRSYKQRFYILFLFSLSAFAQYCAWNAFGPISGTMKAVFGWGNSEIALLASLDPITYLLTMLFFSWLMDVKGLRVSLVVSLFLMSLGTGLRCVSSHPDTALWTMTAGQFFNGLGGPVTQAAPPLLSSVWFPRSERTTATAVASLCGSLGVAFSFLISPYMVGRVDHDSFEFSKLASNYSYLSQDLYKNKTIPLSDSLYKDAAHYWSMDNTIQRFTPSQANGDLYKTLGFVNASGQINQTTEFGGRKQVNLENFTGSCLGKPSLCTSGLTVSVWLKYKRSSERQHFLGTSAGDSRQTGFIVYQDIHKNGSTYVGITVRTKMKEWTLRASVPQDTWTHVFFTWSPREGLRVHTNGTLAGETKEFNMVTSFYNNRTSFVLGKAKASYDELAIWYQALTDEEAKAIFVRTSGIDFSALDAAKSRAKKKFLEEREHEIMKLLYMEFGVTAALFFCAVVYFPDKPPTPPSHSSAAAREDFFAGLKQLLRHKQFWTLSMIYGITTGVYCGWGAVLALNLESFNIDQGKAGWIGFYVTISGIGAGILLARFSDFFGGRIKRLLLFLYLCSSASFLLFSLLCLHIIPFSDGSLYPSSIIGGFSICGTIPLFYELTVECTYPIAEGVTTGVLTIINNLWTVAFLFVVMIPGIGTTWMNWCLFASCAGCIPVLMFFKERYGRMVIDSGIEVKTTCVDEDFSDNRFKTRSIFASTLSMAGVDDFMERLYKSKESRL